MQKEVESKMSDDPESHEDRVLNMVHAILVRDGRIKSTDEPTCTICGEPRHDLVDQVCAWCSRAAHLRFLNAYEEMRPKLFRAEAALTYIERNAPNGIAIVAAALADG